MADSLEETVRELIETAATVELNPLNEITAALGAGVLLLARACDQLQARLAALEEQR